MRHELLRMIGQFLIAQAPILPELKRTQQDRYAAERDVPARSISSPE
jgi:hypothetical protein